jgi:hypothetical protein
LLFHEYNPGQATSQIDGAQPAWRFLTESFGGSS